MLERLRAALLEFILRGIDRTTATLTTYRAALSHMELGAIEEEREYKDDAMAKIALLIRMRWAVDLLVPAVLLILAAEGLRLVAPARQFDTMTGYLISLWPNWALAAVGLAVNAAYNQLLRRRESLRPVAHAQVWMDIVILTLMIYASGGIISPFSFLLTVPVLAASLLLSFRASLAAAAFSTFVLGLLAELQFTGIIPTERYFGPLRPLLDNGGHVAAIVTFNAVLLFLIVFASGALTRTIHKHEKTLNRRANEATMLYEVSSCLQSALHLDEILQRIMETVVNRLDIDRALMYLVNGAEDGLDLKVTYFHPKLKDPPRDDLRVHFPLIREAGLTAICALDKAVFNVTDPLNHPHINRDLARRIGLNPFALAPMMSRGRVIGVIGIDRKFRGGIITHEEAQILAVAANQAGLTIQNAELYERSAEGKAA